MMSENGDKHASIETEDSINAKLQRRLDFLLKQTEIYSHFVTNVHSKEKNINRKRGNGTNRHRLKENADPNSSPAKNSKLKNLVNSPHFETTPHFIKNGEMRDYQLQGLNWIISLFENGINGILADEMGLGKTLQTISFLGYLKHYKNMKGPFLVVAPKSTLHNWMNELKRWCPSLKAVCFIGSKNYRYHFKKDVLNAGDWNVCVTSYEICKIEKTPLTKLKWQYIVVDEAHSMKNEHSLLAKVMRLMHSDNRLLLTGTPLQNNLHELWALLNFLLPEVFNSSVDFDSWFDSEECITNNINTIERLHSILKPFLLRRIKDEIEKSLLPKKEIYVYCGLADLQKEYYKKVLGKHLEIIRGSGFTATHFLHNILMHLRKCSMHPYLFLGVEPGPPFTCDEHLVLSSGKMIILDKLLQRLKAEGSRVLLFSQMVRMLDIIEDYCFLRKYKILRLDGDVKDYKERQDMVDSFNDKDSSTFIFLISTRAGGLGINLIGANVVILFDSDWNPQVDLQAMDRAHRIGQTKQVRVFRLITENTIEEKIIERAERKLKLDSLVIQKGRLTAEKTKVGKTLMYEMIRHGAEDILASKYTNSKEQSIDAILAGETVKKSSYKMK